MKHKIGYNRLGRKAAHRKAMTRNMLTSLFRHERIRTTKAKALAVRSTAEKMITRAKEDSVHNRRMIGRDIKDKAVLAKLFTEVGPRFKERPGGYTRVLKLGPRPSDAAEMVILELLPDGEQEATKKGSKAGEKKKASAKKTDEKKTAAPKAPADKKSAPKAEKAEVVKDAPAKDKPVEDDGATAAAVADASAPADATAEEADSAKE
jgi:large subunit ribosomal protein L17